MRILQTTQKSPSWWRRWGRWSPWASWWGRPRWCPTWGRWLRKGGCRGAGPRDGSRWGQRAFRPLGSSAAGGCLPRGSSWTSWGPPKDSGSPSSLMTRQQWWGELEKKPKHAKNIPNKYNKLQNKGQTLLMLQCDYKMTWPCEIQTLLMELIIQVFQLSTKIHLCSYK